MMSKRTAQGLSIDRTVRVSLPDGALTVVYRFSGEIAARHRPLIDRLNRTGDRRIVERLSLDLVKSWDITDRGRAVPVTGKTWRRLSPNDQDAILAAIAEDSQTVHRAMERMATVAGRART